MKELLKSMTKGCYDIQQLRIQMGNRITANFKVKLGIEPGKPEADSEADVKKILSVLRLSYDRITDGVPRITKRRKFEYDGVISDFSELSLIDQYMQLLSAEETHFKRLGTMLEDFPIWTEFMADIKGIGPAMGAVIISEIDIEKAKYPSSIWKYAGLDVVKGEGRSRKKHHLEESEYTDKQGEIKTKMGITFNPFLKTKLIGVLGSSFLRSKSDYSEIYYNYKNRLVNHPNHQEKTKGHIHNMAVRYMVKIFLQNLYVEWRTLEGLPVSDTYQEAKLGHVHGALTNTAK